MLREGREGCVLWKHVCERERSCSSSRNRRRIKEIYVEGEGFEGIEGGWGRMHAVEVHMREREIVFIKQKEKEAGVGRRSLF